MAFTDSQFLTATRWRLGLNTTPPSCTACCHQYVSFPHDTCNLPLDLWGHHAVTCNVGGGPSCYLHNPISDICCDILNEAGFQARREVSIPEFTRPKRVRGVVVEGEFEDGIVDVLAWHVLRGELLLDITVRHPLTPTYISKAALIPGHAAQVAEKQKHDRYPSADGRSITPVALETFGRIGAEFDELLLTVAAISRDKDRRQGCSGTRCLSRWRLLLSTAVAKGIAKLIEDSHTRHAGNARKPPPGPLTLHHSLQRWTSRHPPLHSLPDTLARMILFP